ncbi:MAG: hypothetical protein AB7D03_03685 [Thiomicrospira sp.]
MGIEHNLGLLLAGIAMGALFGAVAMDLYLTLTRNNKEQHHE